MVTPLVLELDWDEPSNNHLLSVTVKVVDDGIPQLESLCTFLVTVQDINDNPPTFDRQRGFAPHADTPCGRKQGLGYELSYL
ncbi:unnamed protein product [Cyprideis torosa]|uniref:Uncharacterized protein n=1 Tax=Cyprideis torosa TaxID=163714 RepID=A0A7R8WRY6_9CRUS|nr:unnamed protein product [Cyprideis torosa]CAG0904310.1 unnamed protein product [Cyprideis torosa]